MARETILRALELGINFLDTADTYGIGDNEELVGTVYDTYVTPRWGEKVALQYAADLPAVPPWPFK